MRHVYRLSIKYLTTHVCPVRVALLLHASYQGHTGTRLQSRGAPTLTLTLTLTLTHSVELLPPLQVASRGYWRFILGFSLGESLLKMIFFILTSREGDAFENNDAEKIMINVFGLTPYDGVSSILLSTPLDFLSLLHV